MASCHGGFIFTLADCAFAFACNTRNDRAVASHCSISYLRPGKLGDRLVAVAEERALAGRSGIYDIRVTAGDTLIAEFRGHSRNIGGKFFEDRRMRALPDLSPKPGDLEPIERASRDEITALQTRAAALVAAPRLRQRAALPACVRRGRRASRRFPHAGRSREIPDHDASSICARTIRSACSPCRASASRASMPRPARPGSRPSSATRRRISTSGRDLMARSIRAAGGRPGMRLHNRLRLRPVHRRPRRCITAPSAWAAPSFRCRAARPSGRCSSSSISSRTSSRSRRATCWRILDGFRAAGIDPARNVAEGRHLRRRAVDQRHARRDRAANSRCTPSISTACPK